MGNERIVIDPKIMMGKPCIRGTRIPVEHVLMELADGASFQDIIATYPRLTTEDIAAAISYAALAVSRETQHIESGK